MKWPCFGRIPRHKKKEKEKKSNTRIQSSFFASYEYELLIKVAYFKLGKFPFSMCFWFLVFGYNRFNLSYQNIIVIIHLSRCHFGCARNLFIIFVFIYFIICQMTHSHHSFVKIYFL